MEETRLLLLRPNYSKLQIKPLLAYTQSSLTSFKIYHKNILLFQCH